MKSTYNIKVLLLLATVLFTACQMEEVPPVTEGAKTGCIVLSVPKVEVYTQDGTRADGNIADYIYTIRSLEGTAHVLAEDSAITFTDNKAIIPAGTYTLTATSKITQEAGPWYRGTSAEFTLGKGETKSISIDLGKPKNAEVAVTFAESFTALYENYSITIGNHALQANGSLYAVPGEKISYTIKGTAKAGSHVSDIPADGITGTLNVAAGSSYPLNITASSISDLLIQIGEGTHNDEFDTKEFRF